MPGILAKNTGARRAGATKEHQVSHDLILHTELAVPSRKRVVARHEDVRVRVLLRHSTCDRSVVAWSFVADVVRVSANMVFPCFVFHLS